MANVSWQRQAELVHTLRELIERHSAVTSQIELTWRVQSDNCRHKFQQQRIDSQQRLTREYNTLQENYQRQCSESHEACIADSKAACEEQQDKIELARQTLQTALSEGEYDWFLLKKRTEKEHKSDLDKLRNESTIAKRNLIHHADAFNQLARNIKSSLAKHGCKFKVSGGDSLVELDATDYLTQHCEIVVRIQQQLKEFNTSFWVRFTEDRYYLIVFLVSLVGVAYPFHLLLPAAILTVTATLTTAIGSAALAWYIGQSSARRIAKRRLDELHTHATAGKQTLLAAQRRVQIEHNNAQEQLVAGYHSRLQHMDTQWTQLRQQLHSTYQQRESELQDNSTRQTIAAEQRHAATKAQLDAALTPAQQDIVRQTERNTLDLDRNESAELAKIREEYECDLRSCLADSQRKWDAIRLEIETMYRDTSRVDLLAGPSPDATALADGVRPFPLAVGFGQHRIDLSSFVEESQAAAFGPETTTQAMPTSIELPLAMDLVNGGSIAVESSQASDGQAQQLMRVAILRLLTSLPAGKLRLTIIDAIGLGQDFSALMHLADHDEQLINHRIWTEPRHILQRLTDLTQHMEKVIQTYLRNEFANIQDYNRNAGEVAEPFQLLVISNFPAGFSEEAAQRLLSIVSNGPRCGVFTVLTFDPARSMPRHFDLDALRRSTSVLRVEGGELHFALEPLRTSTIQLDILPDDATTTAWLHDVGSRAKLAFRVEVPFSAVAPAREAWWNGDSRSEITVPIGRAGATKLMSLQLGRGTSQHVLVAGKTGSGKSTLLHALITNLALHYSPQEVQFYLIDFKKGVEFKSYAEHTLPHARVIAIESEREFGMSVLERLDVELRRRGDLFRRVGVQSLAGYRDARAEEAMPRILLVIDEFQELFVKEDKISQDAALLLDRLVRQGRAFGIHVVLGSQTLGGAYSLARTTIGQMAVRIALQCSASDANLILSDDNDAARLLRRPGEAIYNDANGLVEGNHPFQVVWLTDLERDNLLRELAQRHLADANANSRYVKQPLVFEGNVAPDVSRNELLRNVWESPAPHDVPLAPRAWLGEAIAIKEPPAVVFSRRSGGNLLLVGQQDEAALGVMASSLISVAGFSPPHSSSATRFVVLDGTRPEASHAGYWQQLAETIGLPLTIVKARDSLASIQLLHQELTERRSGSQESYPATFLLVYDLARFRDLQKTEDDFGFGSFDQKATVSPAESLADILRDGPDNGIHTMLWSDTHTNLMRWIDRQSLRDLESRVLFQMSTSDSSNLMDSSAASQLGPHRAIYFSEDQGRAERFRPYGLPSADFLLRIRSRWAERVRGSSDQYAEG